jgi:TRAP-type C4-dicarboxylate transport system substrate-binding protein
MRPKARLAALTAALILSGSAVQAKELRYNLFDVPRSTPAQVIFKFFDDVKAESKGALSARIFTGGQLLNAPATLKGIGDRVVDAGFVVPSLNQGQLKATNVIPDLLPFVSDPMASTIAALQTALLDCKECLDEHRAANVVWLGGFGPDPWHLVCREPITKAADLQGRRVRVTGASPTRLARALGMVPVQLPPTEIAPAFQGGQIDCACGPLIWLRDYALWDVAKSAVEAPFGVYGGLGTFTFNRDVFAAFTPQERALLLKLMPISAVEGTLLHINTAAEVRKAAQARGVVFWKPDADFAAKVADFRKAEIANLTEDMRKRGVANAEAVIRLHLGNIERAETLVRESGGEAARLIGIVRDEIYAKAPALQQR